MLTKIHDAKRIVILHCNADITKQEYLNELLLLWIHRMLLDLEQGGTSFLITIIIYCKEALELFKKMMLAVVSFPDVLNKSICFLSKILILNSIKIELESLFNRRFASISLIINVAPFQISHCWVSSVSIIWLNYYRYEYCSANICTSSNITLLHFMRKTDLLLYAALLLIKCYFANLGILEMI